MGVGGSACCPLNNSTANKWLFVLSLWRLRPSRIPALNPILDLCRPFSIHSLPGEKIRKTRPCTIVRNSECQLLGGSGWVVIGILKSRRHEHIWFVSCGKMVIWGGLWVSFVGMVRSVWVIVEWAESHWIIGVISFQKIYGLYSVKHHRVEKWS